MSLLFKKIGVGILIWVAAAIAMWLIYEVLPPDKWVTLLVWPTAMGFALLIFRLVREESPDSGLDAIEMLIYTVIVLHTTRGAWIWVSQ